MHAQLLHYFISAVVKELALIKLSELMLHYISTDVSCLLTGVH